MDKEFLNKLQRYMELSDKFRKPLSDFVKPIDYTSSVIYGGTSSTIKPSYYTTIGTNSKCLPSYYTNYSQMEFEKNKDLTIPEKIIAKAKEKLENAKTLYECYQQNLEEDIRKDFESRMAASKASLESAEEGVISSEHKAKTYIEYQEYLQLEKEIKNYLKENNG